MMLNGGRFNAQVVNGSPRLPVYAAADAVAAFQAEAEGRVEVRGAGVAQAQLLGAFASSAVRQGYGDATPFEPVLVGTMARRRVGHAETPLTVDADTLAGLMYRNGFADAVLQVDANGTPIIFRGADSESIVNLQADADGRIEVRGTGAAQAQLLGTFASSAIRQATGEAMPLVSDLTGTMARRRVGHGGAQLSLDADTLTGLMYRNGFVDALLRVVSDGTPIVIRVPDTESIVNLQAEILLTAQRFPQVSDAQLENAAQFEPSAIRVAEGVGAIPLDASLFYTRERRGEGGAELRLVLRGDVGVVFIDGELVMHPMTTAVVPTRKRWSPGAGDIRVSGDLLASAVRRANAYGSVELRHEGELDPAHVAADGTRYITPDVRLPTALAAQDAGFYRQVTIGSMPPLLFDTQAEGSARRKRQTLANTAPVGLFFSADFLSTKPFPPSALVLDTEADGVGDIYVRATGDAVLETDAQTTGQVTRFASGVSESAFVVALTGLRRRTSTSAVGLTFDVAFAGTRRRVPQASTLEVSGLSGQVVFSAERRTTGTLDWLLEADGAGEVLVRATGEAAISLVGGLVGYRTKHITDLGESVVEVQTTFDQVRWLIDLPTLSASVTADGTGTRSPVPQGDLTLPFVSGAGAVSAQRRTTGAADWRIDADGFGEVLVPGAGAAAVSLAGGLVGYRTKQFADVGENVVEVQTTFDKARWLITLPTLSANVSADGTGTNRRTLAGDAALETLGESEAYINAAATDTDEQVFIRPLTDRDFIRTANEREFLRAA